MKSNPISQGDKPMEKRIMYFDLVEMIEGYIDQVGITKATADILTVLSNRLNDKLRIIGPALKEDKVE